MQQISKTLQNIVLPTVILAPLLLCLVGCFYVPWIEHRTDADHTNNARALVGPADSQRRLRPGFATRSQVQAVLGYPEFVSLDGRSEAYINHTSFGVWVFPLCFAAYNASDKVYAVRINYDANGTMVSYEWAEDMETLSNASARHRAIDKLNQHGPQLYEANSNGKLDTQP